MTRLTRRGWMLTATTFAAGTAAARAAQAQSCSDDAQLKVGKGLRDLSDDSLTSFRQMGIEHVVMPTRFNLRPARRGLVPAATRGPQNDGLLQPWDAGELQRIKDHLGERGLTAGAAHLGAMWRVLHGKPDADAEIENVKKSVRAAGAAGIPVIEYNFTPLRGSEGYASERGRGGIRLRNYDSARTENLPPFENVGKHSRAQMWQRLERFLRAVIPVAEDADVRLAMHPNDPPIPSFRGAAQPVRTIEDQKRLIDTVDSPSNGITLDTGVTTEMGEDVVEAIRYFGSRDRINHVHFRNVRVDVPYYKYLEVRHDAGDCDMLASMKTLQQVGYRYLIIPDHTPEFTNDSAGSQLGWAFAIGYLRALKQAAESPAV
jgi:mannonate dehydratase